jgi:NAD(P)-dependent dehydrogenase (short-subunit alcohol dehydrogenase family)
LIEGGLLLEPRWGQPADIGRAVALLACGELTYAPGQVLTADGGLTLGRL